MAAGNGIYVRCERWDTVSKERRHLCPSSGFHAKPHMETSFVTIPKASFCKLSRAVRTSFFLLKTFFGFCPGSCSGVSCQRRQLQWIMTHASCARRWRLGLTRARLYFTHNPIYSPTPKEEEEEEKNELLVDISCLYAPEEALKSDLDVSNQAYFSAEDEICPVVEYIFC